jgi:2-methylcitrate dehydratase PrpD
MTGLTAELAERSAELSFDRLPDSVVAMARLCVLDWLGVTIVGSGEPAPRIVLQTLAPDAVEDAEAVIAAVALPAADLDVWAVSRLTRHLCL